MTDRNQIEAQGIRATHGALRYQILTQRDAVEFLTGQWATTPAEIGFNYDAADIAGYSRNATLELAHQLADEIEQRRAKA